MSDNDSPANDSQASSNDDWLKTADLWWSQALSEAGAGFRARLDVWAKKPAQAVESASPVTDFDQDFQALVGPRLEGYVRLGGYLVSLGLESFSDAHDRVMGVARRLGALHLSDGAFWALDTWIDQALLQAISGPAPSGVISPERLADITRVRRR